MSHHYYTLFFLLLWMFGPLACFWQAPRKNRDPYLWVFWSTLLGPLVALIYLSLPARKIA